MNKGLLISFIVNCFNKKNGSLFLKIFFLFLVFLNVFQAESSAGEEDVVEDVCEDVIQDVSEDIVQDVCEEVPQIRGECGPLFSIFGDFIYFNAVEDQLRYAETNTFSLNPPGRSVYQKFDYSPGGRAGISFPLGYEQWKCTSVYTYFRSSPSSVTETDPLQYLFASLDAVGSYLSGFSNTQCGYVHGTWKLSLQVVDFVIERLFSIGKFFVVSPIFGLKGSFVNQRVVVKYDDFYVALPTVAYAKKVVGKSDLWGIGPAIGGRIGICFPRQWELFVKGAFSPMIGKFELGSKYTDIENSDLSFSKINDQLSRVFTVTELQIGFGKVGDSKEFSIGWETQFWWRQMRMNWFNTIQPPPEGGDLVLYGPFARMLIAF